jgi:hypothetical protein
MDYGYDAMADLDVPRHTISTALNESGLIVLFQVLKKNMMNERV